MGGLGLTDGILDAYTYGNALVRHSRNGESDDILNRCASLRRDVWRHNTNPTSELNLMRMRAFDEEAVKDREVFFRRLKEEPAFAAEIVRGMMDMLPETFAAD